MPSSTKQRKVQKREIPLSAKVRLKAGDTVMVIAGGNKKKRPNIGQVGKILRFAGKNKDRVVVEGLNLYTKHKRQTTPDTQSAKVQMEGPIHISNVMYYAEKISRPVKLTARRLEDGKKVRGYMDPESKEFVQI